MSANSKNKILVYANGYDQNVTGSNNFLTAIWPDGYKLHFLVDCGQYFGKETTLNRTFPYKASTIDLAFLTHVHIDHCGRYPKLIHEGFTGPIYATKGSALLYPNAISNSASIIIANSKRLKEDPGFDENDVEASIENINNHQKEYDIEYEYKGRLYYRFIHNQHLFGASSILIRLTDPDPEVEDVNLFFLGDFNDRNLFVEDFKIPKEVTDMDISCFLTESTYGDSESKDIQYKFYDYLQKGIQDYNTTIFFAFSLGRSQDILFLLKKAQESGALPYDVDIFLDGPLSISDTLLIARNPDVLDIRESSRDFLPEGLGFIDKGSRDFFLNSNKKKKIIVTSSGMGTFGPAKEYISKLIDVPKVLMVFGGYCTDDSIGRYLMDFQLGDEVRVFGKLKTKRATFGYLEELSGHARADKLVRHIANFNVRSILINHGEFEKQKSLKERIDEELHPSKGSYILTRNYTYRITCYGIDKYFYSTPNEQ